MQCRRHGAKRRRCTTALVQCRRHGAKRKRCTTALVQCRRQGAKRRRCTTALVQCRRHGAKGRRCTTALVQCRRHGAKRRRCNTALVQCRRHGANRGRSRLWNRTCTDSLCKERNSTIFDYFWRRIHIHQRWLNLIPVVSLWPCEVISPGVPMPEAAVLRRVGQQGGCKWCNAAHRHGHGGELPTTRARVHQGGHCAPPTRHYQFTTLPWQQSHTKQERSACSRNNSFFF